MGQGGLAEPAGDMISREGVNRAERRGKDDKGSYVPDAAGAGGYLTSAGKKAKGGLGLS